MSLRSFTLRLRRRLKRLILSPSGPLARAAIHRNPYRRPARRACVDVARDTGIGDVIMLTPALRALKQANPAGIIRFYTNFGDLVRGLPYIDEVHPFAARPEGNIFVEYTDVVPSPVHLAKLMGDRLGVKVDDTHPDCMVDATLVEGYRQAWQALPSPRVVVVRRASRFTPNKDWPAEHWNELLAALCAFGSVIEVGDRDPDMAPPASAHYLDLRGGTSIKQLVAAIAAADVYVGPVSGPMHIAAAVHTPSVVIIGGYEHPVNAHYTGNVEFFTELACSPCWLREACPFDLTCLRVISSTQVMQAVRGVWDRSDGRHEPVTADQVPQNVR